MRRALLVVLIGLASAANLVAQSRVAAAPAAVQLGGIVIEDGSNPAKPVRRAIVTVTGTGLATPLQVVTDDSGRFVFASLLAGRYSLTAEKAPYVKTYYGSAGLTRPPGMPIALGEGKPVTDLNVRLVRGAAISGVARDQFGTPLAGAQIQIRLTTYVNGARRLGSPYAGSQMATSDDRGAYRAWGLPPGEYLVSVGGGGAGGSSSARVATAAEIADATRRLSGGGVSTTSQPPGSGPAAPLQEARLATYFPSTLDPDQAQVIPLGAGDDRGGINIIALRGRVARITGTTVGPSGPVTNMSVGIANLTTGSMFTSMGGIRANASGEFSVAGLTPGRWLLFGRGAEPNTPSDRTFPWWAETEVVIGDQDVASAVLRFLPGSTITGRLVFQGSAARPDISKLRVGLSDVPRINGLSSFVPPVTPQPDGSFTIQLVPPGRFRLSVAAAGAWSVRSAIASGSDILDVPLEIMPGQDASLTVTLTDQPTEISGVLLDQLGRPAPEYSVIVFSSDRTHWGLSPRRSSGIVRLGSDGRYRVTGLPSGDYLLCVVTDVEPGSLNDPSFLEQLARSGIAIKLGEGEKKTQDFKIGGGS